MLPPKDYAESDVSVQSHNPDMSETSDKAEAHPGKQDDEQITKESETTDLKAEAPAPFPTNVQITNESETHPGSASTASPTEQATLTPSPTPSRKSRTLVCL